MFLLKLQHVDVTVLVSPVMRLDLPEHGYDQEGGDLIDRCVDSFFVWIAAWHAGVEG